MNLKIFFLLVGFLCAGTAFSDDFSSVHRIKVPKARNYSIETVAIYRDISHYKELNDFMTDFCNTLKARFQGMGIEEIRNIPDSIGELCEVKDANAPMHLAIGKPVMIYGGINNRVWMKGMTFDFEIFGKEDDGCFLVYKAQLTVVLDDLATASPGLVDEIMQQLIKLKYLRQP